MTFLRRIFDRMVEHEFRWAGTLIKLAVVWSSAFLGLLVFFFAVYRLKGLLSTIPPVIQAACLILVALTILLIRSMFRERGQALQAYNRFLAAFEDLKPASQNERATGISRDKMALIRHQAGSLPGRPGEWWRVLDQAMEYYTSADADEGWFLTRSVPECLPEEDVVDAYYHSAFHQSVPGILTSLGLLATFVAILMALAGVTYNALDPVRPVSGIDQLINGLSGKFLSSIIALLLSVIFTFLEKKVCDRQLRNGYDALIKRCRDLFPFLTQTRILLDIQRVAIGPTRQAAAAERV